MEATLVIIAVFVGVAALVGGVAYMFRGVENRTVEDRLEVLTNSGNAAKKAAKQQEASLLAKALERDRHTAIDEFVMRFLNLQKFLDQADIQIRLEQFIIVSIVFAVMGAIAAYFAGVHIGVVPVVGLGLSTIPFVWCVLERKKRFAAFQKQLPDAAELIGRALRAGHSLAAGFKLVADEMSAPIGTEFARVYEEQNLGVPLEEALDNMSERIPNLDLQFFATAVILQRQTGGDLAEILDKIGHLVRDRFRIWGAIQALTGEGRISGIVLLGLPPVLFAAIWYLNPQYIQILFTDPLGKKMLTFAIFLQFVGAMVIRKIINIRV